MSKIFISYRRVDSGDATDRIYDELIKAFGRENVFKDVDSIGGGADFRKAIIQAINQSRVMLVIIGPQWLTLPSLTGRSRLYNPDDYVRMEIEFGLNDPGMLIIPVLLGDTPPPDMRQLPPTISQLAFRNALAVRRDPEFHFTMNRLIKEIAKHIPLDSSAPPPSWAAYPSRPVLPPPPVTSSSRLFGRICMLAGILLFLAFFLPWASTDVSCTADNALGVDPNAVCMQSLNEFQPLDQTANGVTLASGVISIQGKLSVTPIDTVDTFGASELWILPLAAFALFFAPLLTLRNAFIAKWGHIIVVIVAGIVLAVIFIYFSRLSQAFPDFKSFQYQGGLTYLATAVQAGIGLWLAGGAALAALAVSLMGYLQRQK